MYCCADCKFGYKYAWSDNKRTDAEQTEYRSFLPVFSSLQPPTINRPSFWLPEPQALNICPRFKRRLSVYVYILRRLKLVFLCQPHRKACILPCVRRLEKCQKPMTPACWSLRLAQAGPTPPIMTGQPSRKRLVSGIRSIVIANRAQSYRMWNARHCGLYRKHRKRYYGEYGKWGYYESPFLISTPKTRSVSDANAIEPATASAPTPPDLRWQMQPLSLSAENLLYPHIPYMSPCGESFRYVRYEFKHEHNPCCSYGYYEDKFWEVSWTQEWYDEEGHKNIAAVPKSLIIARAPRQNIESPTNSVRFSCKKLIQRCGAGIINAIFTNSEGCIDVNPRLISSALRIARVPKTRFTSSNGTAAPIINMRMPFALFKSRRYQHRARNIINPSSMAISCFEHRFGQLREAVTARLSVERKNAISSISKPILRSERINRKYAHITTHSPSIHSGSAEGQSSPSEMTSCSAVSIWKKCSVPQDTSMVKGALIFHSVVGVISLLLKTYREQCKRSSPMEITSPIFTMADFAEHSLAVYIGKAVFGGHIRIGPVPNHCFLSAWRDFLKRSCCQHPHRSLRLCLLRFPVAQRRGIAGFVWT